MKIVYSSGKWCFLKNVHSLDARPLITINEFLEKKLKYDMSLGMKTT